MCLKSVRNATRDQMRDIKRKRGCQSEGVVVGVVGLAIKQIAFHLRLLVCSSVCISSMINEPGGW